MSDARISMFTAALTILLKKQRVPMEAIGDLADLLGTTEELVSLLEGLAGADSLSEEEILSKLYRLQIMVEQDLPMIISDLLPVLQGLSGEILGRPEGHPRTSS